MLSKGKKGANYKIVIGKNLGFKPRGGIGRFVEDWLYSKLNHSKESKSTKGVVNLYQYSGDCNVIVQMVDDSDKSLPTLVHNSKSALSGVSAILYHAGYFGDEFNDDEGYFILTRLYWRTISLNFQSFLRLLPLNSSLPLVVLYWNHDTLDSFEQKVPKC